MAKVAAAKTTIHGAIRAAIHYREILSGKSYANPEDILARFPDKDWPKAVRSSRKMMDRVVEEMIRYEEATGQWPPHG